MLPYIEIMYIRVVLLNLIFVCLQLSLDHTK